jgi:hypothetical protein
MITKCGRAEAGYSTIGCAAWALQPPDRLFSPTPSRKGKDLALGGQTQYAYRSRASAFPHQGGKFHR